MSDIAAHGLLEGIRAGSANRAIKRYMENFRIIGQVCHRTQRKTKCATTDQAEAAQMHSTQIRHLLNVMFSGILCELNDDADILIL